MPQNAAGIRRGEKETPQREQNTGAAQGGSFVWGTGNRIDFSPEQTVSLFLFPAGVLFPQSGNAHVPSFPGPGTGGLYNFKEKGRFLDKIRGSIQDAVSVDKGLTMVLPLCGVRKAEGYAIVITAKKRKQKQRNANRHKNADEDYRRKIMLELQNIRKSFGGVPVLKDISVQVNDGEIVSILGPSGCGKTTLLNLILGIIHTDEGKILYDGEDFTDVSMEKRGFNIVFQDYALFPNLNVYKNITYGLKNRPDISTKEEVEDLIDLLGLREHLAKSVDQLSGGQKQRVALARTMVMKPRILLLDEPLSALDGVIKESIKERIKTIAREYHLTTIIVTHDPEEALTLSDRVLIIEGGMISQYGCPDSIIHAPRNDFVRKFILNQLEIKRNNIYALFGDRMGTPAVHTL